MSMTVEQLEDFLTDVAAEDVRKKIDAARAAAMAEGLDVVTLLYSKGDDGHFTYALRGGCCAYHTSHLLLEALTGILHDRIEDAEEERHLH